MDKFVGDLVKLTINYIIFMNTGETAKYQSASLKKIYSGKIPKSVHLIRNVFTCEI